MDKIIIREAIDTDIEEILKLENLFFYPWTYSVPQLDELISFRYSYVAEANGTIIGFIIGAWSPISDECDEIVDYMEINKMENIFTINSIGVLDGYRNMGIGKSLMENVIDDCELNDIKEIYLQVKISNTYAIKLYEGMGFEKICTLKDYYDCADDTHEDGFFMVKKIDYTSS